MSRTKNNSLEIIQHSFMLNLIFTALIFIQLVLTMIIAYVTVVILVHADVLSLGAVQLNFSIVRLLLIFAAVSIVLGSISSLLIGRLPIKSVKLTISALNSLAAGNFQTRLRLGPWISRLSAIQQMTDSFNKMAEELEKTEMLRSDFINNFSHEFKTPIVSIAGFAALVNHGNLTESQRAEYLDVIEEESMRLSDMATNVLKLTRVENQTILSGVQRFNLSEQLRSCVLLLESRWTAKDLEIDIDFQEHYLSGNEELLKEVWVNLIDNAIKFSPQGGKIRIRMTEQETSLAVSIANSGSEIPPDSLERIFQKFYQADESHSSQGNGIGLAIVKKVTDLHRGQVSAFCRDGWTTFTVVLPVE